MPYELDISPTQQRKGEKVEIKTYHFVEVSEEDLEQLMMALYWKL